MATTHEADAEQSWALIRHVSMLQVNEASKSGSTSSNVLAISKCSPLKNLPAELRNKIWAYVLKHDAIDIAAWGSGIKLRGRTYDDSYAVNKLRLDLGLLLLSTIYGIRHHHPRLNIAIDSPLTLPRTSRQIYAEATPLMYQVNVVRFRDVRDLTTLRRCISLIGAFASSVESVYTEDFIIDYLRPAGRGDISKLLTDQPVERVPFFSRYFTNVKRLIVPLHEARALCHFDEYSDRHNTMVQEEHSKGHWIQYATRLHQRYPDFTFDVYRDLIERHILQREGSSKIKIIWEAHTNELSHFAVAKMVAHGWQFRHGRLFSSW